MMGSWRFNLWFGLGGAALTLLFAWSSNGLMLAAQRSLYAFLAFFILAYLIRLVVSIIFHTDQDAAALQERQTDEEQEHKGQLLDLTTPEDEEDLGELLKPRLEKELSQVPDKAVDFQPLQPERLFSRAGREPGEMAKALRHLQEGE